MTASANVEVISRLTSPSAARAKARASSSLARAAVAEDVEIAQPYDAYYDGVVKKDIRALEYLCGRSATIDGRRPNGRSAENGRRRGLRPARREGLERRGCKVATRIVAVTESGGTGGRRLLPCRGLVGVTTHSGGLIPAIVNSDVTRDGRATRVV